MTQFLPLFVGTLTTMIVVLDPFGNLPVFMSLTARYTPERRKKVAWQSNVLALIILLLFAFFGFKVFSLMDITPQALQISGGVLLLLIALQLLTGEESDPGREGGTLNVAAVPLGTPLLAGPGSIVALMLQMQNANKQPLLILAVVGATVLVLAFSWLTMYFANSIMRALGRSGVAILTKLSGMLLAAIAMQLIISGLLGVYETFIAH